jgi:hypothetical protein
LLFSNAQSVRRPCQSSWSGYCDLKKIMPIEFQAVARNGSHPSTRAN